MFWGSSSLLFNVSGLPLPFIPCFGAPPAFYSMFRGSQPFIQCFWAPPILYSMFWGSPSLVFNEQLWLFYTLVVKGPTHVADLLPLSSAVDKNAWRYTSAPHGCMTWCWIKRGDKYTFYVVKFIKVVCSDDVRLCWLSPSSRYEFIFCFCSNG
jgi:hypothetical protein